MRPEPIAELRERLLRERRRVVHLIAGQILDERLASPLGRGIPPEAVVARIDVEETAPMSRPLLTRRDLGRDFWVADESGRALINIGDRWDPEIDLRLEGPFSEHREDGRASYVRILRTGDPVYVWGRATLLPHSDGYRDGSDLAISTVIRVCDEPAFRQLSAWSALPWYRKLSVLVRNR